MLKGTAKKTKETQLTCNIELRGDGAKKPTLLLKGVVGFVLLIGSAEMSEPCLRRPFWRLATDASLTLHIAEHRGPVH